MRRIRYDAAMEMAYAKEKPRTEQAVFVADDFEFETVDSETVDSETDGEQKLTVTHGKAGDFIVKGQDGKRRVMTRKEFTEKYDTEGIPEFRDHPSDINKAGFRDDIAERKAKAAQLETAKDEQQLRPTKMEPQNVPDGPDGKPNPDNLSESELDARTKPDSEL